MCDAKDESEAALPVAEAARRLGVSTLRVRQYVAEGRLDALRDNRGRLLVRLDAAGVRPPQGVPTVSATDLLMDELLELREDDAERAAQTERLTRMVGELSGLLGRALDALEQAKGEAAAERARATAFAEQTARALEVAERALSAAQRRKRDYAGDRNG
jgi:excisionase family DNA binding protein